MIITIITTQGNFQKIIYSEKYNYTGRTKQKKQINSYRDKLKNCRTGKNEPVLQIFDKKALPIFHTPCRFSYILSLYPTNIVFPTFTAGDLRLPVLPRHTFKIASFSSCPGLNSMIFLPLPAYIMSKELRRSHAASFFMVSFLASAILFNFKLFCSKYF